MFDYYTVYRVQQEGPGSAYRGASLAGKDTWRFFTDPNSEKPVDLRSFATATKDKDGTVQTTDSTGFLQTFTPLTGEYAARHAEAYQLDSDQIPSVKRPNGVYMMLHAMVVPEWYEDAHAPAGQKEDQQFWRLDHMLVELRGVPAEPMEIHQWSDKNFYQKQYDGSWKKVNPPSKWKDRRAGDVPDTHSKYYDPETKMYAPERARLHDQIIAKMFEGKHPAKEGEKPVMVLFVGMPASGKSMAEATEGRPEAVTLDPDNIITQLPEYQSALETFDRSGAEQVYHEGGFVNDQAWKKASDEGYHQVFSGTGGDSVWMKWLIQEMGQRGYEVQLVMPHVEDMDDLMIRQEARGERTGRFVPPDRMQTLQSQLPGNFMQYARMPEVKRALLIDNSTTDDGGVAGKLAYMHTKDDEGNLNEVVPDPEFWGRFQESAGVEESIVSEDREAQMDPETAEIVKQWTGAMQKGHEDLMAKPKRFKKGEGVRDSLPEYVPDWFKEQQEDSEG